MRGHALARTDQPVAQAEDAIDVGSLRLAGRATFLAIGTLGLSAIALALYFGDAGEVFGPVSDVLVAASFALLAPAVVAVRRLAVGAAGRWFDALSAAALGGLVVAVAGQLLLVAGVLPLQGSFVTLGIGAILLVAWAAGSAVLAFRHEVPGRDVGRWSLALVGLTLVTAVGTPALGLGTAELSVVFGIPLLVASVGWLVALARDLLRRA